ncbi:cell division protein SepF [bacterium]|nr:cell division protein SepF [bacterium]
MAITEKIKGIVDFLTQGLEQPGDEVFEDMMNEVGDDYETEYNLALAPAYQQTPFQQKNERTDLKVISHPNMRGAEVMIIEPRSFGEAGQIVQNLKDRKTIVLNLHLLDKEQSQRTIDFVCGAASALNGQPQKVGDMVFVFTPNNVTLTVDAAKTQTNLGESLWGGRTL